MKRPATSLRMLAPGLAALLLAGGYLDALAAQAGAARPRTATPRGPLGAEERATVDLFERARGSVVYIAPTQRVFSPWARNALEVERGTGSGFIWDDAGHVVTNNHVIEGASGAQVRLVDGRSFEAELVGRSPYHDLAVLRIRAGAQHPPPLPIGTSSDLKVGQKVFAVGNPFGLDWTLTTGIVSALNRELPGDAGNSIRDLIQTDAAINPGNSGGPLLDSAGRLIGVNTAIYSPSGAYAGVGFAVPVDTVNRVVPRLIATGRYTPPDAGIETSSQYNDWLIEQFGVAGVYVVGVARGSSAAAAGVRPATIDRRGRVTAGDVIVAFGDQRIDDLADFDDALDRATPGQVVTLTIQRGRERLRVDVRLTVGR